MEEASNQPKRGRGRPRLSDEDKKRRNMTFRVRDELRDAVEEIASQNGRSLSEQVEYFVEKCVMAEAHLQYEYSTAGISPKIRNAISTHAAVSNIPAGTLGLPKTAHHGGGQNHHSTKSTIHSKIDAIELASVLLKAVHHGAIEALGETLGSDVLDALSSSTILIGSDVPLHQAPEQYRQHHLHVRCAEAEAEVERLRKENRELKEAAKAEDQSTPVAAADGSSLKSVSVIVDLGRTATEDFLQAMSAFDALKENPNQECLNLALENAQGKFAEASAKQLKCFYLLGAVEVCGANLIEGFSIECRREEEIQQQGCILASRIVKSREEPFHLMEQFSERWRMFGAADAREQFEGTEKRNASQA